MFFSAIFSKIVSFIAVCLPVLSGISAIWWFFSDFRGSVVDGLISKVSGLVGDMRAEVNFGSISSVLGKVDVFFPVTLFFDLLSTYIEIALVVISVKLVRNFIPGLS